MITILEFIVISVITLFSYVLIKTIKEYYFTKQFNMIQGIIMLVVGIMLYRDGRRRLRELKK